MTGSLVLETLFLGILIGTVGVLAAKPLVRLLSGISISKLAGSVDKFLGKPTVGLVFGVTCTCAGVFLVTILALPYARDPKIISAVLTGILVAVFIASGTLATHKALEELRRNPKTSQAGKNYPYHRIV